jgi:thymidylate kinase/O-antigen/teichoic acid export membrane protein
MPQSLQLPSDSRFARLISHARTPLFARAYALIISGAASSGLGVVYWALAARLYDPVTVGLNAAAVSAMTFISYVAQLNMAGLLSRFIPISAAAAARRLIVRSYLAACAASAVGALVFVIVFARRLGLGPMLAQDPPTGAWFILATVAWSLFAIEDGVLTGLRRTFWVPIENSAFGIAKIALLLVFAGSIAHIGIFASWTIPATMLVVPVNWLIFRRFVPRHAAAASCEPAPSAAADALPGGIVRYLMGDYIGSLWYAACIGLLPLIVVAVAGSRFGAFFYIAWTIASAMYLISISMATSLMVEGAARQRALAHDAWRIFRLLGQVQIFLTVLVLIAAPLILTVFNPAYASAADGLLRLLALAALPHGVIAIYLAVARVRRQVKRIITVQATMAGIALGLSVALLGPMGIGGVGVAWLIAQTSVATVVLVTELLPLWRSAPAEDATDDSVSGALAAAQDRGSASAPLLPAIIDALDAADVRWCLLRGDPADTARGARDMDLLVERADHDRLAELLARSGFVRVPGYGRGRRSFHVGYDRHGRSWVYLDVISDLAYGPFAELETPVAAGCLTRRTRSGQLPTLDSDDAFWVLVLHCIIEKQAVAPRHGDRLRSLVDAASDDGPMGSFVGSLLPAPWTPGRIRAAVRVADWDRLLGLRATMLSRLRWSDPVGIVRRSLLRAAQRALGYCRLIFRPWGLSVAVLGPDGAGKTTLTTAIEAEFGLPVRRVYMGMWGQADAGWVRRTPGLAILVRPVIVWRKTLAAWYHRARGRLVVFDRYTYDALLPPSGRLARMKRVYFWFLAHTAPAPDLVLLLDLSGTLLFARKGESDPVSLERDRVAFQSLAGRVRGFQIVDGSRPLDAVRDDVIERIWGQYLTRSAAARDRPAASLVGPHDAALSTIAPLVIGARSRIVDGRGSTAIRARSRTALVLLREAGVVESSGWIVGPVRWSDTKVAVAPIGPSGEPPQLVLKWPSSADALASLRAQKGILGRLHADERLAGWSSLVPVSVFEGEADGFSFFVESAMPGINADSLHGDSGMRRRSLEAAADAIAGLHARTSARRLVDDEMLEAWIGRPVRTISELLGSRSEGGAAVRALQVLSRELSAAFTGRDLSVGWIHGDYWLGNVLTSADGSRVTGIVDWDLASPNQPQLLDPVHLVLMARRSLAGNEFGDVVRGFLRDGSLTSAERSALAASGAVQLADPAEVRRAVQLAWLRHVGTFATGIDGSNPRWIRRNIEAVLKALPDVVSAATGR